MAFYIGPNNDPALIEALSKTADWEADALCWEYRNDPKYDWFPEHGARPHAAKRICARCPVKDECLEFALDFDITAGVWGGMSPAERKALRRQSSRW